MQQKEGREQKRKGELLVHTAHTADQHRCALSVDQNQPVYYRPCPRLWITARLPAKTSPWTRAVWKWGTGLLLAGTYVHNGAGERLLDAIEQC